MIVPHSLSSKEVVLEEVLVIVPQSLSSKEVVLEEVLETVSGCISYPSLAAEICFPMVQLG